MKNKTKKFHKVAKDYKARNLAITSSCLACVALGLFIPLSSEYNKENTLLTQQIEVLENDDLQVLADNDADVIVKDKLVRYNFEEIK